MVKMHVKRMVMGPKFQPTGSEGPEVGGGSEACFWTRKVGGPKSLSSPSALAPGRNFALCLLLAGVSGGGLAGPWVNGRAALGTGVQCPEAQQGSLGWSWGGEVCQGRGSTVDVVRCRKRHTFFVLE